MENSTTQTTTETTATTPFPPPEPGDPRYDFAVVTSAVGDLMAKVTPDHIALPTPCPDFTVKEMLEHIVLVMRRVAAIGRGEHWSTITEDLVDSGWHDQYREAAHAVMQAWTDPAKLEAMYEVPWGEVPGVPFFLTYTGELATHGWDLATSIGAEFTIDDDVLGPTLEGARLVLPDVDREHPDMPFGPVVEPPAGSSNLLQLAGWFGRDVA